MVADVEPLGVVAVVVFVFGLVMVAGTLIGLLEGTSEQRVVTDIVVGSLFGLGPMVAGVVLFRHVVRKEPQNSH